MKKFTIKIRNIKGYGDSSDPIILNLDSKKINYVVAPNGTGKSSLATAFASLTSRKLDVPVCNRYHKNKSISCSLSLQIDDNGILTADGRYDHISSQIHPYVINNRIMAATTAEEVGAGVLNSSEIQVQRVKIESEIPEWTHVNYDFGPLTHKIRSNELMFIARRICQNPQILLKVESIFPCLKQFSNNKPCKKALSELIDYIIKQPGSSIRGLEKQISDSQFKKIERYKGYKDYENKIKSSLKNPSKLLLFVYFYAILLMYQTDNESLKKNINWAKYQQEKASIEKNLECLKCPWKSSILKEEGGNLYIDFPLADEISNGQRDTMTLYAQLLLFKIRRKPGKDYLLILDEVFDYLDDSNLLAAQYLLTDILQQKVENSNVYIVLLTHLLKYQVRTYIFNKYLSTTQYLIPGGPVPIKETKCYIAYRDWLKGYKDIDDNKYQLYQDISNNILHYSPGLVDYQQRIHDNNRPGQHSTKETWGKKETFYNYLISQVECYFKGENYDVYAVAVAIRIRLEKYIYEQLTTSDAKQAYLEENETKDKVGVAFDNGVDSPSCLLFLMAIGNEANHMALDEETEKWTVYKLHNNVIKSIAEELFSYIEGKELDVSLILG